MSILSSLGSGLNSVLGSVGLGGSYKNQTNTGSLAQNQNQYSQSQNFNQYTQPTYQQLLQQQQGGYANLAAGMGAGYQGLQNQAMGLVNNYGQVQQQQLANLYAQQQAQQQQNLLNRGLDNSTIANSVSSGLTQQQALAQANLGQNINQQQLGMLGQFGLATQGAEQGIGLNALGAQNALASQYYGQLGQQGVQSQATGGNTNQYTQGAAQGYGLNANTSLNPGSLFAPGGGEIASAFAPQGGYGGGYGSGYALPGGSNVGSYYGGF